MYVYNEERHYRSQAAFLSKGHPLPNSSIETGPSGSTHTCSFIVGKMALASLLVGWLVPCSAIRCRLADGGTTVTETVVRESITSPMNRDFGSSGKYGMSSKIDGGEHQLRSGNLARGNEVGD